MRVFIGFLLVICSIAANARPITFGIVHATTDCDGVAVASADYSAFRFIIDTVSIPAADSGCVQDGATPDVVPANAQDETVTLNPDGESVTIDLPPGSYFIRGLSQLDGSWSQFGPEINPTVGPREPRSILIVIP